jgi:hypothetical protein
MENNWITKQGLHCDVGPWRTTSKSLDLNSSTIPTTSHHGTEPLWRHVLGLSFFKWPDGWIEGKMEKCWAFFKSWADNQGGALVEWVPLRPSPYNSDWVRFLPVVLCCMFPLSLLYLPVLHCNKKEKTFWVKSQVFRVTPQPFTTHNDSEQFRAISAVITRGQK